MSKGGLTANQKAVMAAFPMAGVEHRLQVRHLAGMLSRPPTGIVETAASLVRRGLLARHVDRDRRVYYFRPPAL